MRFPLAALLLLLPGLAFAADAAPTPLQAFFGQLSGPLLDLVAAAAVAGIAMLTHYLRSKAQESKVAGIGALLTEACRAAVLELDRSLKPKLQAALADGILTDKEKEELKVAALDVVKTRLPASALASAKGVFGDFLDTFLKGKIEQAVVEKNALQAQAVAPVPPTP